jgi:hypothetical protein
MELKTPPRRMGFHSKGRPARAASDSMRVDAMYAYGQTMS